MSYTSVESCHGVWQRYEVHSEYSVAVAWTQKKKTEKNSAAEDASTDSPYSDVCWHIHVIHARYTNETTSVEQEWCISSGCLGDERMAERGLRDRRGWRMCTQRDWCCAPVHSAGCRHENSRIFPTTHVHTARGRACRVCLSPRGALATLADRNYRLSCRKSIFFPSLCFPISVLACIAKNM